MASVCDVCGKKPIFGMVVSQIQLVDGITRTLTCPVVHL